MGNGNQLHFVLRQRADELSDKHLPKVSTISILILSLGKHYYLLRHVVLRQSLMLILSYVYTLNHSHFSMKSIDLMVII